MPGRTLILRKGAAVVAAAGTMLAGPSMFGHLLPTRPSLPSASAQGTKSFPDAADVEGTAPPVAPQVEVADLARKATHEEVSSPIETPPVVLIPETTAAAKGEIVEPPAPRRPPPARTVRTSEPTHPSTPTTTPPASSTTTLPATINPRGALAFVSDRAGSEQIFVANPDGSALTQVTFGTPATAPTWLGVTGGMAYIRKTGQLPQGNLVVRSAAGAESTVVPNGGASRPAGSPDGTRIVYESTESTPATQLFVINVDGTGKRQLTASACFNGQPAWSPDGLRIAFWSSRDNCGNYDLYTMNADGSAQTRLTTGAPAYANGAPSWSPDGRQIAFESTRDGNAEVYVMNADGSGPRRLTNDAAADGQPRWNADGTRLAFQSNRAGNFDIYSMDLAGSDVRQVTSDRGNDTGPVWRRAVV